MSPSDDLNEAPYAYVAVGRRTPLVDMFTFDLDGNIRHTGDHILDWIRLFVEDCSYSERLIFKYKTLLMIRTWISKNFTIKEFEIVRQRVYQHFGFHFTHPKYYIKYMINKDVADWSILY